MRRKLTSEDLLSMRLPKHLWRHTHEDIRVVEGRSFSITYMRRMVHAGLPDGIYIHGPSGSGRSGFAAVIAKEAMRNDFSTLWVTADGLLRSYLEKEWFSEDTLLFDRAKTVDLLVIDDFGKEPRGAFEARLFENLIRERSSHRRATFVTTSMEPSEVAERYGAGLIEVLKECCYPVTLGAT